MECDMTDSIKKLAKRDFERFKKQLMLIRPVYNDKVSRAWIKHQTEKRLGQLAMIEAIADTFDLEDATVQEQVKKFQLEPKAIVLGAALCVKQLIASESTSKHTIGSYLYKLINTALDTLPKELLGNPETYVTAEAQFFSFINDMKIQKTLSHYLSVKYGIASPYEHINQFGDQVKFLRRLAENQNFIFFSPVRRQLIGHYATSSADTISYIPYSMALGAGYTAGREVGEQISESSIVKGGVTAGGMYLGYMCLGPMGAGLGLATHRFTKRMIKNSMGFLFGGIIGGAVRKASRGALYCLLYTQFGAMIVMKDIATGACYYVTDKEKFKKFFSLPKKIEKELDKAEMIDQDTLDTLFGNAVDPEADFSELTVKTSELGMFGQKAAAEQARAASEYDGLTFK